MMDWWVMGLRIVNVAIGLLIAWLIGDDIKLTFLTYMVVTIYIAMRH